MSSLFSAIANLFRRLFRTTVRSQARDRTALSEHSYSGPVSVSSPSDTTRERRGDPSNSLRPSRPEPSRPVLNRPRPNRAPLRDTDSTTNRAANREPITVNAVPAELRQLVYQASYSMPKQRMHAGQFGSCLRQADASFSYEKYGFTKLIYLLEAVPDIVTLERVNNPGAAPAYYVRPAVDVRQQLMQAIKRYSSEDGWIHVDSVLEALMRPIPSDDAVPTAALSILTYGFSQITPFLQSCSDLVEFNPDSPTYVRLRQKRELTKPKLSTANRPHTVAGATSARTGIRIVHLSKFAGFSPQVLNQKVSELAAIALPERWYFGPNPPENFAYPILKSYLRYTFIRLQHERKVITSDNRQSRAFNTGLLDRLLRPIYAILSPALSPEQRWDLTFCIPGEGAAGKMLVANFADLPTAANYLSNPGKVFYHLGAGTPDVDWQHIIKDNMERLPPDFLARYAPANFTYRPTQSLVGSEFHTYKRSFAAALDADPIAYRNIVSRLEEALSRTLLKTQINYKTAVPTYYPNINSIDLLLPICLVEENVADCAIVARQADSGKYIGHTILTLRQAYNNARLICKLDEHWLTRSMTLSQENFEEEDDDSEEFEATDDVEIAGSLSA